MNNASVGLRSAFEATPMAAMREVSETNTLGVMATIRAPLPGDRGVHPSSWRHSFAAQVVGAYGQPPW